MAHTVSSRVRESRAGEAGVRGRTGHSQRRKQMTQCVLSRNHKKHGINGHRERSREWQEVGLVSEVGGPRPRQRRPHPGAGDVQVGHGEPVKVSEQERSAVRDQ